MLSMLIFGIERFSGRGIMEPGTISTREVELMTTGDQAENAAAGTGANQGDSPTPQPSASAAAAAGSVGPGALAAAEKPNETTRNAPPAKATELVGGLTKDDIETLRGLAQQLGGVDALIRWLQLHADLT
jgi:hypothetical protein